MRKLSTIEFINRLQDVHGDSFDTSKVVYRGAKDYVTLICNRCGMEFEAYPDNLVRLGTGCPSCAKKKTSVAPVNLYLVASKEKPYIKIGVTSSTLKKRFGSYLRELDVIAIFKVTSREVALKIEKRVLDEFQTPVTGLPNGSEWVNERDLKYILITITRMLYGDESY